MANRRMFSKTITNSSRFLMMPASAQCLYFHLGMNADDDGFVEHFTIMRMTDSKPDDLRILQTKGFVKIFDEQVLVILDWKENNFIRSDRYTPSKYLELYKQELLSLATDGIPDGNQMVDQRETQDRLGKDRLGKDRLGNKKILAFFDKFWAAYPKKRSKGQAEKAFMKINPDEQLLEIMVSTIKRAKKSRGWLKDEGKYIPYPATWLNAKGWEDEYIINPLEGKLSETGQEAVKVLQGWIKNKENEEVKDAKQG